MTVPRPPYPGRGSAERRDSLRAIANPIAGSPSTRSAYRSTHSNRTATVSERLTAASTPNTISAMWASSPRPSCRDLICCNEDANDEFSRSISLSSSEIRVSSARSYFSDVITRPPTLRDCYIKIIRLKTILQDGIKMPRAKLLPIPSVLRTVAVSAA